MAARLLGAGGRRVLQGRRVVVGQRWLAHGRRVLVGVGATSLGLVNLLLELTEEIACVGNKLAQTPASCLSKRPLSAPHHGPWLPQSLASLGRSGSSWVALAGHVGLGSTWELAQLRVVCAHLLEAAWLLLEPGDGAGRTRWGWLVLHQLQHRARVHQQVVGHLAVKLALVTAPMPAEVLTARSSHIKSIHVSSDTKYKLTRAAGEPVALGLAPRAWA